MPGSRWKGLGVSAGLMGLLVVACVQLPPQAPETGPVVVDAAPADTAAWYPVRSATEAGSDAELPAQSAEPEADAAVARADRGSEPAREPEAVRQVEVAAVPLGQEILHAEAVQQLCEEIGNKLGSVSVEDCQRQGFRFGGAYSINERPLVYRELPPRVQDEGAFRVFLMGGIHGDEYSSISIVFKWLDLYHGSELASEFHWRVAPLANPDGLLDHSPAQRQNANGVDLNRNFPSLDWNDQAVRYWQDSTGQNPRRFPGEAAASEPEVQWIIRQIEEFDPDVIVSVHAPYHLLDFDGPAEAPDRIGELYLHQLGVYPGSLGNYAGLDKHIPVVTLELPSAGIMPEAGQISLMWNDLVSWLDREGRKPTL